MNDWQVAISIFADVVRVAFPYGCVFAMGSLITRSALRMMFGGKVEFK